MRQSILDREYISPQSSYLVDGAMKCEIIDFLMSWYQLVNDIQKLRNTD